jgi:probable HAF family extracellular repeat protein
MTPTPEFSSFQRRMEFTVKNFSGSAVVAASVLLWGSSLIWAQSFTVVAIPKSVPDSAISVNNNGSVFVNSGAGAASAVSVWNRNGGVESLDLSGSNNHGISINNSNVVAGTGIPSGATTVAAFVSGPGAGMQWLPSLGGGLSNASALNDSGSVVGYSYTSANLQHAFLWSSANGIEDLTPNLTGNRGATATAINSVNDVVGYYYPAGSTLPVGFLWTQSAGLTELGSTDTLPFAVNTSDTIVGQMVSSNGQHHAFSWTEAGGFVDLGTLGGVESSALSINNSGWIVGTSLSANKNGLLNPFLWTPTGGMQNLNTIAKFTSEDQQTYAIHINDAGVIAVSSNKGGFLLIPKMTVKMTASPNPATVGQTVTFVVTITSIIGAPPNGESIQFTVDGNALGSTTLANGTASFSTTALSQGSHSIVATYIGDQNYLATASATLNETVNQ